MSFQITKYWLHGLGVALVLVGASLLFATMSLRSGLANTPPPQRMIRPRLLSPAPLTPAPVAAPQTFEPLTPDQAVAANEKVPISTAPNPAARPFHLQDASVTDQARALTCLTMAVYYEASDQGPDGEAAVAQVVLNRVRSPIFSKTICGVVLQGSELPTGCQFTFTCDGSLGRRPSESGWKAAYEVAQHALSGSVQKSVGGATHYHTIWVVPYWQPSVVKVRQIGAHVFYRMPGGLGLPAGFAGRYAGGEPPPPQLGDFDTGISPLLIAGDSVVRRDPDKSPIMATPAPAAALVATPAELVELAAQATVDPAFAVSADLARTHDGYFGHVARTQRLPMSSSW